MRIFLIIIRQSIANGILDEGFHAESQYKEESTIDRRKKKHEELVLGMLELLGD